MSNRTLGLCLSIIAAGGCGGAAVTSQTGGTTETVATEAAETHVAGPPFRPTPEESIRTDLARIGVGSVFVVTGLEAPAYDVASDSGAPWLNTVTFSTWRVVGEAVEGFVPVALWRDSEELVDLQECDDTVAMSSPMGVDIRLFVRLDDLKVLVRDSLNVVDARGNRLRVAAGTRMAWVDDHASLVDSEVSVDLDAETSRSLSFGVSVACDHDHCYAEELEGDDDESCYLESDQQEFSFGFGDAVSTDGLYRSSVNPTRMWTQGSCITLDLAPTPDLASLVCEGSTTYESGDDEDDEEDPDDEEKNARRSTSKQAPSASGTVRLGVGEEITGTTDAAGVRAALGPLLRSLEACYRTALGRRADLQGRLLASVTASSRGRVSAARIESSTLRDARVERCTVTAMRLWTVPEGLVDGAMTLRLPLLFRTGAPLPASETVRVEAHAALTSLAGNPLGAVRDEPLTLDDFVRVAPDRVCFHVPLFPYYTGALVPVACVDAASVTASP